MTDIDCVLREQYFIWLLSAKVWVSLMAEADCVV